MKTEPPSLPKIFWALVGICLFLGLLLIVGIVLENKNKFPPLSFLSFSLFSPSPPPPSHFHSDSPSTCEWSPLFPLQSKEINPPQKAQIPPPLQLVDWSQKQTETSLLAFNPQTQSLETWTLTRETLPLQFLKKTTKPLICEKIKAPTCLNLQENIEKILSLNALSPKGGLILIGSNTEIQKSSPQLAIKKFLGMGSSSSSSSPIKIASFDLVDDQVYTHQRLGACGSDLPHDLLWTELRKPTPPSMDADASMGEFLIGAQREGDHILAYDLSNKKGFFTQEVPQHPSFLLRFNPNGLIPSDCSSFSSSNSSSAQSKGTSIKHLSSYFPLLSIVLGSSTEFQDALRILYFHPGSYPQLLRSFDGTPGLVTGSGWKTPNHLLYSTTNPLQTTYKSWILDLQQQGLPTPLLPPPSKNTKETKISQTEEGVGFTEVLTSKTQDQKLLLLNPQTERNSPLIHFLRTTATQLEEGRIQIPLPTSIKPNQGRVLWTPLSGGKYLFVFQSDHHKEPETALLTCK